MILEGAVCEMGLEEDLKDVKDTLGDHKRVLDEHTEKIQDNIEKIQGLTVDSEVMKERWNNISSQLNRIETNSLSTNSALLVSNSEVLKTLKEVVNSNTVKNSNRKEVLVKTIGIGGSVVILLILGYFALKGINLSIPTLLNLK